MEPLSKSVNVLFQSLYIAAFVIGTLSFGVFCYQHDEGCKIISIVCVLITFAIQIIENLYKFAITLNQTP